MFGVEFNDLMILTLIANPASVPYRDLCKTELGFSLDSLILHA
jgi:hypothetical protein